MGTRVLLRTVDDSDWDSTSLVYKYDLKAVIGENLLALSRVLVREKESSFKKERSGFNQ